MARNKNTYIDFTKEAQGIGYAVPTGAIPTAADGQIDAVRTVNGTYFELRQDGANAQIALTGFGATSATGWQLPLDDAADAIELNQGVVSGVSRSFTIGTDKAFFLRTVFKVEHIARNLCWMVGFRKLGTSLTIKAADVNTLKAAYDDKVLIGSTDVASAFGTITSVGGVDTGPTALAKAAITDGKYVAYEIDVSAAGVVTYKIGTGTTAAAAVSDLAADANALAYTFTTALEVIPCIVAIGVAGADGISDTYLVRYECGYQDTN